MTIGFRTLAAVAAIVATPVAVNATPLYDTFGPLTGANFGGTGIPNGSVAISSSFEDGTTIITVAMNATQRYSNPVVTNDGAGTFFAGTGSNTGGNNESPTTGALWNFNYYIDVKSTDPLATPKLTDYDISVFYDFNPAFDNGPANLGVVNVTNALIMGGTPNATNAQGSENLMFAYLASPIPGVLTPPGGAFTSFNPNATGEYNFAIQVGRAGWAVEQVRMDVQVIPVPAAAWLFGSAAGLLVWLRRKVA